MARIATYKDIRADGFISVDLDQGIGTKFDMTFKMRTKEKEALMVYVADDTQVRRFLSCSFVFDKLSLPWSFCVSGYLANFRFWLFLTKGKCAVLIGSIF